MASHLLKIHKSYRLVVAICDKDLFGKRFQEGDKILDISTKFFEGQTIESEELKEQILFLLKEDATFNVVGENSVNLLKELDIISDKGVLKVEGIPHTMILL